MFLTRFCPLECNRSKLWKFLVPNIHRRFSAIETIGMGTKVHNLPGYYSMRDLNEESSSCGWPLFYADRTVTNGQYYSNYLPSNTADAFSLYDKDRLKRTMLEHEAIFKDQVSELHRLYRVQRDLMDEARWKELHRNQMPFEISFSKGPLASQITSIDGQKWHVGGFPMDSSVCARPSVSNVEGIHSPLGSLKENGKQASLFPSPNGNCSEDVEFLDARPSKARRKMFDLHLPAEEYIDTEENEKLSDEKINGTELYTPDRNCNLGKESDVKPFYGNGGKAGCQEDSSKCEQSLRGKNDLADLNEPVQVEETNASPYVHILSHNPSQMATDSSDLYSKEKTQLFGLSKEDLLNSHRATDSQAQNNGYLENNGSGKGWNSMLLEAGQDNSNLKSIPQVLKQEKSISSSQTMQDALKKAHEPSSGYITNRSKADSWREKTVCDLEISERSNEISVNKHPVPESVVSSHRPNLFGVSPKSWSHSASSWEMANSSLSQKSASVQMPPFLNASGAVRSSQSGQSNGIFGDSWSLNINSKSNPGFCCEAPTQNGYYPGSSSGSKEPSVNISSISYDYLNKNECKRVPEHMMNHGSAKYHNGSNCNDMKSGKDVNLNVLYSNCSSNSLILRQSGLEIMDGEQKHEDHLSSLPWLRARSACKNEAQNAGRCRSSGELSFLQPSKSNKDESLKGSSGNFMYNASLVPCSKVIEPKTEVGDGSCKKKILGIPIFEMAHISPKKNTSSLTPPSVSTPNSSDEAVENTRKNQVLDINLPCDPEVLELDQQTATEAIASKKELPTTEASFRNQIDLNLVMSEDEASVTPIPSTNVRKKAEIDLEAPAVPEEEEDVIPAEKQLVAPQVSPPAPQEEAEQPQDELMTNAAEAIVAMSSLLCNQVDDVISSPLESPGVDTLSWFVDVVSSCTDDLRSKFETGRGKECERNEESSSERLDYFEAMTLNLTETKEEDYMPKPLVPESIKLEEMGTSLLPTRTRKGPARRGRQRRDFQRDILPGLSSLSRHEVTEDLQTFGGLMRATGHSWSGLTRRTSSRNGSSRGRRRVQVTLSPPPPPPPPPPLPPPPPVATNETCTQLIQQLSNIEVGLEDRSLAGWGKTTRRPRRQRCPAGNPPAIPLT